MIGSRLAHYEITSHLGTGGMGEVYQATDSKLGRTVAIKLLPEAVTNDAERVARFEREARVLASLNHPHIAAIYGVEEFGGRKFLVMELVPGETLADRVRRGPLPVDDALRVAHQISEALESAHEKGIVHRDLKPANIKITPDGVVKVLDFGLAKILQPEGPGAVNANSPTIMSRTGDGVLMGTAAYMSPEQARGRQIDRSTDIWALGCVLFEMLTAKHAFDGETMTDILGGIVKGEPEWSSLPEATPPRVIWLLRRCLQKNPRERFQSAADVRILVQDAMTVWDQQKPQQRRPRARIAVGAGAGLLIAAIGAAVGALALKPSPSPNPAPVVRMAITSPTPSFSVAPSMAFSPDGTQLAFITGGQLYLRNLNNLDVKMLGRAGSYPFFSFDGKWIGFFLEGRMKKIPVSGGASQNISDAPITGPGASWGPDDMIYYAATGIAGLSKMPASGGTPQPVTTLERDKGEISHRWPQILPGGKAVLFTAWTGPGSDERHTYLQVLETGERRVIAQGAEMGRYVPSGHIVFAQSGKLTAIPFDLATLKTTGAPMPLPEAIRKGSEGPPFALSADGTLAYIPRNSDPALHVVWVDQTGTIENFSLPPRTYDHAVLSPDERRAAIETSDGIVRIWIYDFARNDLTPLTPGDSSSQSPVWTPDGKRVAYRATRKGFRNIYWKAADGSSDEERLTMGNGNQTAGSFSPDGKWLAYWEADSATGPDLWLLPLEGDRVPKVFLQTPSIEINPRFSPNGKWIAYESNESGQSEVYVRAFDGTGGKFPISVNGGEEPVWSRTGSQIFYLRGQNMMAVEIRTQPTFSAGTPRKLYQQGAFTSTGTRASSFDVASDGRFLRVQRTNIEPTAPQMNIVVNWLEELKKLATQK